MTTVGICLQTCRSMLTCMSLQASDSVLYMVRDICEQFRFQLKQHILELQSLSRHNYRSHSQLFSCLHRLDMQYNSDWLRQEGVKDMADLTNILLDCIGRPRSDINLEGDNRGIPQRFINILPSQTNNLV